LTSSMTIPFSARYCRTRGKIGQRHRRLIAPGGELVTLIYPLRPGADTGEDTDGPPFAMSEKIVRGLLEKNGFVATMMEPVKAEDATAEYRIGKEILARWKLAAGASN